MTNKHQTCVHVLATPDYAPELCSLTVPSIQRYAERIGADFNLIQTRRFPDYPINYERLQVHDAGKQYRWNINIDADMVIGKELPDITRSHPMDSVYVVMQYDLDKHFRLENDIFFERDGRYIGVVDAFVATTCWTHDVWEPLPGPFSQYRPLCKDEGYRRISEYCLSRNLAKYGLKIAGAFKRTDPIFHVGYTSGNSADAVERARAKLREWGEL